MSPSASTAVSPRSLSPVPAPATRLTKLQRVLGFVGSTHTVPSSGGAASTTTAAAKRISVALSEPELFRLPLMLFEATEVDSYRARALCTTFEVTIQSSGREDLLAFGDVFAGRAMSTYPVNLALGVREGDPIADSFTVRLYENRIVAAVADGCGWGPASALAARTAVRVFNSFVKARRHACSNVRQAMQLVLDAFCAAHVEVCATPTEQGQFGTTTLAGGILLMVAAPDKESAAAPQLLQPPQPSQPPLPTPPAPTAAAADDDEVILMEDLEDLEDLPETIDDDNHSDDADDRLPPDDDVDATDEPTAPDAVRKASMTSEHPPAEALLRASSTQRSDAAAGPRDTADQYAFVFACVGDLKVFHCARKADGSCVVVDVTRGDTKSHSGDTKWRAEDPGGRIGPQLRESEIDGNGRGTRADLRNLMTRRVLCSPDDIIVMMSDGVADNLDPEVLGLPPAADATKEWKDLSEAQQHAEKTEWRTAFLADALRKSGWRPRDFTRAVLRFCADTTRPSRRFMEQNPGKALPCDFKEFPGKQDHASLLAFTCPQKFAE